MPDVHFYHYYTTEAWRLLIAHFLKLNVSQRFPFLILKIDLLNVRCTIEFIRCT